MTVRLAIRALVTRPVRSAVLACGFGFGIAVMAALLGVGEVVLEQARSPWLAGGGDLSLSGAGGKVRTARFVMQGVLGSEGFAERVAAVSPTSRTTLYLVREGADPEPVPATGGIPSLERAIGDPESSPIAAWTDSASDRAWTSPDPAELLRVMDRFHPIPDLEGREESWAEWLYFNGRADEASFYLSFIFGPDDGAGLRPAVARLQLERDGRRTAYAATAEVDGERLLREAPDVDVAGNSVRLEGLRYRITLDLPQERPGRGAGAPPRLTGTLTLDATPGRSFPPFTVRGARGWLSGYVVPVMSGRLGGSLTIGNEVIRLDGGSGYHDHNWGVWEGVTWQWGRVAHEDLSLVFGRVRAPADAVDPERLPGFLGVLGPDGPLGFSMAVRIAEDDDPATGAPRRIRIDARGPSLSLELSLEIEDVVRTALRDRARDFIQMRARYTVEGTVAGREIEFSAVGEAETFRNPGS